MSAPCPTFGFIVRILSHGPRGDNAGIRDELNRMLDANGLVGSAGVRAGELIVTRDGSPATDADRQQVMAWATSRDVHIDVSDIVDLSDL